MKRTKILIFIAVTVFILSLILCFWAIRPAQTNSVEIVQDGKILYRFDLNDAENQQIEISYNGKVNVVLIENGKICITNANCPDNTCVHMGWLTSEDLPIVCLPNRLVIQYTQSDETDAAVR